MTDEEKAEEILQTKGSMTFCAKGCGYTEKVKELIAIGLAEGRKEKEKKDKGFCETVCMKGGKVAELEKENKISEEIIIGEQQEINRLEKENAELKAKLNEYVNIVEDDEVKCVKLQKKIKGLEEQIESLTKENDVLIKGLGCETCSITGEYLKLNNTIRELGEENAELKAQIEKMKCCEICKHNYYDDEEIRYCNVLNQHQMVMFKKCDKWELAE